MNSKVLFAALLFMGGLGFPQAQEIRSLHSEVIPNQYIILFKDDVKASAAAEDLVKTHGLVLLHVYSKVLRGFSGLIPPEKLGAVRGDPRVKAVGQDRTIHAAGQTIPTGINRVDAEPGLPADAGAGVSVAVIDTGISLGHKDLASAIRGGVTLVTSEAATTTGGDDDEGHGTHVAGSVAAADDDADVMGAAPQVGLWAVKVLNSRGSGAFSDVIAGVDWVADTTTHTFISVANMSLGAACEVCTDHSADPTISALHQAIKNAVGLGTAFVAAAGNAGLDAQTTVPASFDEVITVSALADTDGRPGGKGPSAVLAGLGKVSDDTFAKFSNFGADVDVMAPGLLILSTKLGGGTVKMNGTSMAAAHIAGVSALVVAANPAATPLDVRRALIESGECADGSTRGKTNCPQPWPQDTDGLAEPLVNAERASRFSLAPPPPAVSIMLISDKASYASGSYAGAALTAVIKDENGNAVTNLSSSSFRNALDGVDVALSFQKSTTPGTYLALLSLEKLSAGHHAVASNVTDQRGLSNAAVLVFQLAWATSTVMSAQAVEVGAKVEAGDEAVALGTASLSVRELNAVFRAGEVYAFPNPAKGGKPPTIHAEFGLADSAIVRIYDSSGKLVEEASLSGPPGVVDDGEGPEYAYEWTWAGSAASGVYPFLVEALRGSERLRGSGKIVVIR